MKELLESTKKEIEQIRAEVMVLRKINDDLKQELLATKGVLCLLKDVDRISRLEVEPNDLLVFSDNGGIETLNNLEVKSHYDFAKNVQVYEW